MVTGAGGFIPGHVCAELVHRGARVRALCRYTSHGGIGTLQALAPEVRDAIEVMRGDVRDAESAGDALRGAGAVIHAAAEIAVPYSQANPRAFFETNVLGSLNVAQAARRHGIRRLVHVSSSEVYGTARSVPITETHPVAPRSPYAASKAGADALMSSFHHSFGLPVAVVRPFNTYGPHQTARALVPTVMTQALAGGPVRLGALNPTRDLTFVTDTAAGLADAVEAPGIEGEVIQLGTGRELSVREVVELVGALLDRELEIRQEPERLRPASSEVDRLLSDASRAHERLGWTPRVAPEDGFRRTLEWLGRRPVEHPERYVT